MTQASSCLPASIRSALATAFREGDPATIRLLTRLNRAAVFETTAHGVVHELRNPLQAITMAANSMSDDDTLEAPLMRRLAGVVAEAADNLEVSFARLLGSMVGPVHGGRPEPIALGSLAEAAAHVIRRTRGLGELEIEVRLPPSLPAVCASGAALRHALSNLLLNAAEHGTPEGGRVVVHGDVRDGVVGMYVSDSGTGIPADDRERVFEPFFTTDQTGERLGLGLAVTRAVASEWGGEVGLAAEESGTTVRVTIPVAPATRG